MYAPRRARLLALIAILVLTALVPPHARADSGGSDNEPLNGVTACGVERWAVKTGMDADAHLVNQKSVVRTTIGYLRSLPAPAQLPPRNRLRPVETTMWSVDASLLRYRMEPDSDYHLVLADSSGHTMIAESPAPQCIGVSPFLPAIRVVRRAFTTRFAPTKVWQRLRLAVSVTGVGFFDFKHGQSGVAPNAIELHPVLGMRWLGGGTTSPPPASATPVLAVLYVRTTNARGRGVERYTGAYGVTGAASRVPFI
jgi:hypothetical protein